MYEQSTKKDFKKMIFVARNQIFQGTLQWLKNPEFEKLRGARCYNVQRCCMSKRACVDRRKTVDLVSVPLDVLPERCTLTMHPEISARRSLSA